MQALEINWLYRCRFHTRQLQNRLTTRYVVFQLMVLSIECYYYKVMSLCLVQKPNNSSQRCVWSSTLCVCMEKENKISLQKSHANNNLANMLTKPATKEKFISCRSFLGFDLIQQLMIRQTMTQFNLLKCGRMSKSCHIL